MKKILVTILLGVVSAVSLNADDLALANECLKKKQKSACQKLIDKGLPSVEKCVDGQVCAAIGLIYEFAENYHQALPYYEKACDLKHKDSCSLVGYAYKNGEGAKQDFTKARKYYKKACDMESGEGCLDLAFLYVKGQGVKQDKAMAKKYYGKACDLGLQGGCDSYRKLNEQGIK